MLFFVVLSLSGSIWVIVCDGKGLCFFLCVSVCHVFVCPVFVSECVYICVCPL